MQNALFCSFATVSNGQRLIRLEMSAFVRFAPGAAVFKRAAMGGANVFSQIVVCGEDEGAAGHMASSRVSFPCRVLLEVRVCVVRSGRTASERITESTGLKVPLLAEEKPSSVYSVTVRTRGCTERTCCPIGRRQDDALATVGTDEGEVVLADQLSVAFKGMLSCIKRSGIVNTTTFEVTDGYTTYS